MTTDNSQLNGYAQALQDVDDIDDDILTHPDLDGFNPPTTTSTSSDSISTTDSSDAIE